MMPMLTLSPLLAAHPLATLNAVLNSIAAVLLVIGWVTIARGNWKAHRAAMVAAFAVSAIFLVSYLTYHAIAGSVPFRGQGPVRIVYFAILISHVILAAAVPLLALRMFFLAWKQRWEAHRRLGRITLPIWLYVSVTGVVIYAMLYHLFPG
jgi:putative membrane protein